MRGPLVVLLAVGFALAAKGRAHASGHGPAYGFATPTLGAGGFSLDVAAMGRLRDDEKSRALLRPMLGYGITEDLQVSVSVPMPLHTSGGLVPVRMMMMMPATSDVEALLAWRFHRQAPKVGARFESTAYAGFQYPTAISPRNATNAPGLSGGLVTGYASRTIYAWVGGLYQRYMPPTGGAPQPGDLVMYSAVFGYRPPFFQEDFPAPDWRIFVEAVGEYTFRDEISGQEVDDSGGHQIFVGPTVLGLYGAWGISGGPLFAVYERLNGSQAGDVFRLAVNFTYWF